MVKYHMPLTALNSKIFNKYFQSLNKNSFQFGDQNTYKLKKNESILLN